MSIPYCPDHGVDAPVAVAGGPLRGLEARIRGLMINDNFGGESQVRVDVHNRAIEQALAQFIGLADVMHGSVPPPPLRTALERAEFALGLALGATYDDRSWLDEAMLARADALDALHPAALPSPAEPPRPTPADFDKLTDEQFLAFCTAAGFDDRIKASLAEVREAEAAQEAPAPEGLRARLHELTTRAVACNERPSLAAWQGLANDAIGLGYEVLAAAPPSRADAAPGALAPVLAKAPQDA